MECGRSWRAMQASLDLTTERRLIDRYTGEKRRRERSVDGPGAPCKLACDVTTERRIIDRYTEEQSWREKKQAI